jgi:cell wall-associated NlpC family hydrolase
VENPFANVYSEPNVTKHQPVLTLPFAARLEVISEPENNGGRWLEVWLADGRTAWIQRGDVSLNPRPLSIEQTIDLAKRFLGFTYLWGGTSSFGFDCSGFTQMLVGRRGIVMPRDADLQAAWAGVVPVKRSKLQAGDLLFFGESSQKITHTGMYIGHGQFIHDSTHEHPGVQIGRLADQPWTHLLVACRRLK